MPRTVTIHSLGEIAQMADDLNRVSEVYGALGYLSTWGPSYGDHVNITADAKQREIGARYSNDEKVTYFIMAVWRDDDERFSFHS